MNTFGNIFQDLADQVRKSFFSRLGIPSFEMLHFFCNSMSPSLDNDCTIQDLAFQVLKLFGVKNFNIRPLPRIMSFMTWSSKTWTQVNIFVKTWQPQVWNLTMFFKTWHAKFWTASLLNCMSPSLDNDYSRLGFPSLETSGLLHGLFFGEHVFWLRCS
jgi:hypothetical protein